MSRRRKPQHHAAPWTPMSRAEPVEVHPDELARRRAAYRAQHGLTDDEIDAVFATQDSAEVWRNDRYTVRVGRRDDDTVAVMSIRRQDRKAAHDWRHFQRIKTEIAGPDVEAFEIYPAEERLVDTANQYWLYCLRPGQRLPVGLDAGARVLADADEAAAVGAGQRTPPADWIDVEACR